MVSLIVYGSRTEGRGSEGAMGEVRPPRGWIVNIEDVFGVFVEEFLVVLLRISGFSVHLRFSI